MPTEGIALDAREGLVGLDDCVEVAGKSKHQNQLNTKKPGASRKRSNVRRISIEPFDGQWSLTKSQMVGTQHGSANISHALHDSSSNSGTAHHSSGSDDEMFPENNADASENNADASDGRSTPLGGPVKHALHIKMVQHLNSSCVLISAP